MDNVLVVTVHPDDETLGCGGTLLKHLRNGDRVHWLIITEPHEGQGFDLSFIENRKKEIIAVTKAYPFNQVFNLDLPPARLDTIPKYQLIEKISAVVTAVAPTIMYLPFKADVHSDHRIVFETAFVCTKTFRYPHLRKILMMETLSETEFAPPFGENAFIPNYFVDITPYLEKKIAIMNLYQSELKPPPFPRSIENIKALAVFRGSTCGSTYAESFMMLKEIDR